MMSTLIKNHLPEWLEAGTIIFTLVVGAISASSITLYKVDAMGDDLAEIKAAITHVPVLVEQQKVASHDIEQLETRLYDLRKHDLEAHHGEER